MNVIYHTNMYTVIFWFVLVQIHIYFQLTRISDYFPQDIVENRRE